MRFARTHKATTYLLLAFSYAAMTAGGGLSPVISLLGAAGLVASWWWEPPLVAWGRWSWAWTIASLLVLGYSALSAVATGDYLQVGAEFLVWLTVAKACNRASARDWLQLYLLAFLMLVAGSVLNADLSYGLCFLGFVITSTWALALFQLRREMEDSFLVKHADEASSERIHVRRILESRRIITGRFLAGTALLSVGVFLGAALLFLALPRVGFGIFGNRKAGLSMAGFSDGVRLGGHGVIKRDPTVVMRVEVDPKWGDRSASAIHWRGVAFDRYSRGKWSRSSAAPRTQTNTMQRGLLRERRYLRYAPPHPSTPLRPRRTDAEVLQNIYLDPLDTEVLFGASMPVYFDTDRSPRGGQRYERNDEVRLPRGGTVHYQVASRLFPAPAQELRAASTRLPDGFEVYLELPPEITQRTRDLAAQLTRGLDNPYDRAAAIRDWLTANLGYTLEQEDPGAREPVDFFLFSRKRGHCEYFASAFVVLARAAGVPSRNVNGFLGGEWNEYDQYIAVRAGDAHSWAEVYLGEHGWVTFDATPPGQVDALGRGAAGALARVQRFLDTLRFQWTKWVVEYDLGRQLTVFRGVGKAARTTAAGIKAAARAAWAHAQPIVAALALVALGLVLWRRRARGTTRPAGPRRVAAPVTSALLLAERALARRGHGRPVERTPVEHASALGARASAAFATYDELVRLHQAVVWGHDSSPEAAARAATLAERLRRELDERADEGATSR